MSSKIYFSIVQYICEPLIRVCFRLILLFLDHREEHITSLLRWRRLYPIRPNRIRASEMELLRLLEFLY